MLDLRMVYSGDSLDQRGDLVDVFMSMPAIGRRAASFRIERQRRCDLERALAPIGHLDRRGVGKLA